jgi:hypothetical protein
MKRFATHATKGSAPKSFEEESQNTSREVAKLDEQAIHRREVFQSNS